MRGGSSNHAWIKIARDTAWGKQKCKCAYCRSRIKREEVTADHVKPRASGGVDKKNIVAACEYCNKAKGKIPVGKFKRMINGGVKSISPQIETVRIIRGLNRKTELACKNILAYVGIKGE